MYSVSHSSQQQLNAMVEEDLSSNAIQNVFANVMISRSSSVSYGQYLASGVSVSDTLEERQLYSIYLDQKLALKDFGAMTAAYKMALSNRFSSILPGKSFMYSMQPWHYAEEQS